MRFGFTWLVAATVIAQSADPISTTFIHGRVVDWSGPVAGRRVWVRDDGLRGSATTDASGGFAIPVAARRPHYVEVLSGCGDRIYLAIPPTDGVSIDAGTIRLGVGHPCPDFFIPAQRAALPQSLDPVTAVAQRPVPKRPEPAVLPPDLVSLAMYDLDWHGLSECAQRHGVVFGESIRATNLALVAGGATAVLVQGIGPCLSGANNGPVVVYAKDGRRWHPVLHQTGNRLERLPTTTRGWNDLELRQHNSAFDEVRRLYQFDGSEYRETSCRVLRFADPLTAKTLPQPVVTPCK